MRGYAIERVTTKVYDVPGRQVNTCLTGTNSRGYMKQSGMPAVYQAAYISAE